LRHNGAIDGDDRFGRGLFTKQRQGHRSGYLIHFATRATSA
jgi:hypothetical protein